MKLTFVGRLVSVFIAGLLICGVSFSYEYTDENPRIPARHIKTNTTTFNGSLSNTTTDVQKALELLDDAVGGSVVTSVSGTSPIISSGGTTPAISLNSTSKTNWDSAYTATHAKQHAITATADHTSTATSGKMLKADSNGLPVDASNTDTDVADAVTKKHVQNTDTALGTMAADINMNSLYQVVNLQAPAAAGEALRQTASSTEVALDNACYTRHTPARTYAGDSMLEVIDGGTGYMSLDVDGASRATITANGLALQTGTRINKFSTDGTLAGNSDYTVPTEKALRTYVGALGGAAYSFGANTFNGTGDFNTTGHGDFGTMNVTGNVVNKAYTSLGSGNPALKIKVLTGTTGSTAGNTVTVAHGLTGTKIVAIFGDVYSYSRHTPMGYYTPGGAGWYPGGYDWTGWWDGTNVNVMTNGYSDYGDNVKNAPFTITVIYQE